MKFCAMWCWLYPHIYTYYVSLLFFYCWQITGKTLKTIIVSCKCQSMWTAYGEKYISLMEVRCIGMSEILLIDPFVLQYFIVVYQLLWPISSITSIFWMQMVIKSMALTSFWGKRRLTFCFSVALWMCQQMLSHLRECLLKVVSRLSWLDVAWQHVVISWLRVIFLKLTWFHAFLNSSSYGQYESCRNFANILDQMTETFQETVHCERRIE